MNANETIIYGPVVPLPGSTVIYSVTLGNGFIITSPQGFEVAAPVPILTPRALPTSQAPAAAA